MSTYIKLHGFYTEQNAGGVAVGGVCMTQRLGNGTVVEFLAPFLPIGNDLAIVPAVKPDGDTGLRIDFACWTPARVSAALVAVIPINVSDQDTAVRMARAFDADSAISWTDPVPVVLDWVSRFLNNPDPVVTPASNPHRVGVSNHHQPSGSGGTRW